MSACAAPSVAHVEFLGVRAREAGGEGILRRRNRVRCTNTHSRSARRPGADLLVRHVHVIVAKWQSHWQAAAGVDNPEQYVSSSVASFLPGHSHAQYGLHARRPRQQDGTGVRDHDDDVLAHRGNSIDQRILLGGQSKTHAVGARVVFAGERAIVSCGDGMRKTRA
jgi:hypothetical protein